MARVAGKALLLLSPMTADNSQNRNIIITGASSGLGAALAMRLADRNTRLGLIARNPEKLSLIVHNCQDKGAVVETGMVDVRDEQAMNDWIQQFDSHWPVDILIANAGITSSIGADGQAESLEQVKSVLATNFDGVLHAIHALLPGMRSRQRGQLVIISSLAAWRGMPVTPAYCASKAAVKAYGDSLRGWLREDNIAVSVICPGFVKSPMSDAFPGDKPFMITAEKAASRIVQAIEKKQALLAFPLALDFGMRLLNLLPASLGDYILQKMSYGASR